MAQAESAGQGLEQTLNDGGGYSNQVSVQSGNVVVVPNEKLVFASPEEGAQGQARAHLVIHNPTDQSVIYKFKTNASRAKVSVSPCVGHIHPSEHADVNVCLNYADKEDIDDLKILVVTAPAPQFDNDLKSVWKQISAENQNITKVKCVVNEPSPPSPAPVEAPVACAPAAPLTAYAQPQPMPQPMPQQCEPVVQQRVICPPPVAPAPPPQPPPPPPEVIVCPPPPPQQMCPPPQQLPIMEAPPTQISAAPSICPPSAPPAPLQMRVQETQPAKPVQQDICPPPPPPQPVQVPCPPPQPAQMCPPPAPIQMCPPTAQMGSTGTQYPARPSMLAYQQEVSRSPSMAMHTPQNYGSGMEMSGMNHTESAVTACGVNQTALQNCLPMSQMYEPNVPDVYYQPQQIQPSQSMAEQQFAPSPPTSQRVPQPLLAFNEQAYTEQGQQPFDPSQAGGRQPTSYFVDVSPIAERERNAAAAETWRLDKNSLIQVCLLAAAGIAATKIFLE